MLFESKLSLFGRITFDEKALRVKEGATKKVP
jgi:hypothetical protein